MKLEQLSWTPAEGWTTERSELQEPGAAQLALVFCSPKSLEDLSFIEELQAKFPEARIIGGSTAGNIQDTSVSDAGAVATVIHLEKGRADVVTTDIDDPAEVRGTARKVVEGLLADDLKHIFVLSDGLEFNGSELAKAIVSGVPATGGLMADMTDFGTTRLIDGASAATKRVIFVGFYGEELDVQAGCAAGWGEFGVDRVITRSEGNVVFEIDNQPALELYKRYLGDFANELPASGLRFPLSIRDPDNGKPLIRTLLSIDEDNQSLVFAGDMPEGAISLLMRGNTTNLINGATSAGEQVGAVEGDKGLGILVSCVGRRLVMDQLVEEEVEAVDDALGESCWLTGFYSYGELAPHSDSLLQCHLHNQTMTLTVISER